MQLLAHDDPNVRYEALLAVQKLMVHNWCVFSIFLKMTLSTEDSQNYELLVFLNL